MKRRRDRIALGIFLLSVLVMLVSLSFVRGAGVKTQLCLVIDGSGSIDNSQWSLMTQAISRAINETIPHDGSVELSIVQFGYPSSEGYAKTELPPTVIDSFNFSVVAAQVLEISKGGGSTPTAQGMFLGWVELKNSPNFGAGTRQVINLATDGVANVRNSNATTDLDGSGGSPNANDDVVAAVKLAVAQGLDELDVEAIGMPANDINWLKNWTVYPQPGIVAPPFTKAGWIRTVVDSAEFARTLGQKMQVIISGNPDIWVPPAEGALFAGLLSVGAMGTVSFLTEASSSGNAVAQKVIGFLPEFLKRWLHEFISSKRKLEITQKAGTPFKLSKLEIASYTVAFLVLTFAFVYAKVQTFDEAFLALPTILATSIVVIFVKNFSVETVARKLGVWTEHRLWFFGIAALLISTLAFRTPFSSPSRNIHHSKGCTIRRLGMIATASVLIGLGLAVTFGIVFLIGFTQIGSVGLVMSLTIAFFEALPIPPMNGKDIYDWSRPLWSVLFVATFSFYMLCLLLLQ